MGSGFDVITSVPHGFKPLASQRAGAGSNEKTNNTRQNLSVFASVDGLAVQIENPLTPLGQMIDLKVSHFVLDAPGSRFGHDRTIVKKEKFAQGDTVMFLDTSHVDEQKKVTNYFYQFDLEVSNGMEVFGNDLAVTCNLFAAPIPVRKKETPHAKLVIPHRTKIVTDTEIIHVVKPNEFLRKIATKHYGDAGKWKVIYEANKAIIGTNPNLIYPGQRLKIPEL